MNLHQIVSGAIGTVNPFAPVTIRVSVGSTTSADGTPVPIYATPGSIVAAISGTVLTVSSVSGGLLQPGQLLSDLTDDLAPNTTIVSQTSGSPGGIGVYAVNVPQTVASETMTTSYVVYGQLQPIQNKDLRQLDGLNLQGTFKKIYLNGHIYGIVRATNKGGDLITTSGGLVWLVTQVLEHWPDWTSAAVTLQDGS